MNYVKDKRVDLAHGDDVSCISVSDGIHVIHRNDECIEIHAGNNEAEFMISMSFEECKKLFQLLGRILEKTR